MFRTWVEVSKSALAHNMRLFKNRVKPAKLMAVVKSNAYGHGLVGTAKIFAKAGADWFGVDSLEEALQLRSISIDKPILIMGYVPMSQLKQAVSADVGLTLYDKKTLVHLAKISEKLGEKAKIHLKIETGMNRQGTTLAELPELLQILKQYPALILEGLCTHFAAAEDPAQDVFTRRQFKSFLAATRMSQEAGFKSVLAHCANTGAALRSKTSHLNLARVGLGLYGLLPSLKLTSKLKPALSWKTKIVQVKLVGKGETISYNRTKRLKRDSVVAVLPVGYWDGYDRKLSSVGQVLINSKLCKVLGRVCMNMTMVDATEAGKVRPGTEVSLLAQPMLNADSLAQKIGTINYEVVTRINPTIPRVYI